jgi:hypothetical protein
MKIWLVVRKSKSVEVYMANDLQQPEIDPGTGEMTEEAKRLKQKHRAEKARQKQALTLQRENILSQRTSQPARRTALQAALSQIEAQLQAMG